MAKKSKSGQKPSQSKNPEFLGPGFSFSVGARMHNYVRADGYSAIYLLVIVDGKRKKLPLKLYCIPKDWDGAKNEIRKTVPNADAFNMIIRKAVSHANNIAIRHRLQGLPLTVQKLEQLMGSTAEMTGDFIQYMDAEITRRGSELKSGTYRHHRTTLNKLRECFPDGLPMSGVNHHAVEAFVQFLHLHALKKNTRTGNLKRWQTYVRRAQRDNLIQGDPFEHEVLRYHRSDRPALNTEEVNRLVELYNSAYLAPGMRSTLQCFLFSCYTGLRIGDLDQVCKRHIINNELVLMPYKTEDLSKTVRIPLNAQALKYLNTDDKEWRFHLPAQATMNEYLKDADRICGIRKNLHYHMSRHTFATRFLDAGGSVEVLQQLMGHADLATTMIYVHVNSSRKRMQMNLMDN